ncbi:MAG: hypothetical protein Q9227_000259 [Pyrenula ochraceoflavens]
MSKPAHCLTVQSLSQELDANLRDGLSAAESDRRLKEFGRNELDEGEGVQPVKILVRQVANAMMLVLLISMIVSFAIQSWIEGGVIAAVFFMNIVIGFVQEFKAEKTMDSIRSLSSPTANVVRDGKTINIPTAEVVPGDMVELKTGDTVPADIRLIEAINFETDEALLTGESLPVQKDDEMVFDHDTGPGDRLNIAFSSSTITKGRGRGIVFATGMRTEIGSIAAALRAKDSKKRPVKRKPDGTAKPHRYAEAWTLTITDAVGRFLGVNIGTPLQKKLSRLAMLLLGIAVICAIIVEASNSFSSNNEIIIYAVATGLSMLPASLIVVLTITMAVGTKRMVKRHVRVRKIDALEALGAVTDICSDKTGTLTQGKMVAKKAWIPCKGIYSVGQSSDPFNPTEGDLGFSSCAPSAINCEKAENEEITRYEALLQDNVPLQEFLNGATLANLATVHEKDGEWTARGDPTEVAIQVFASRFNWNRERWTMGEQPVWRQLCEYPFDSDVKRMSVIFENTETGKQMVYSKGAVERILESCNTVQWEQGQFCEMTEEHESQVLSNMEALAKLGLRVLALASSAYSGKERRASKEGPPDRAHVERNLTFMGLIGLYDPPRPESAASVKACHGAGINVHMLTGDHAGTATSIASQIGILPRQDLISKQVSDAMVMTAKQFDSLTDDQIDRLPVLPLVIARCAPHTKVRMIEALHRRKLFAAMTGDGVNDSPSLKRADIGIAMGLAGSDVAKDAAEIVLTDDNFASILNAIEEGRRMFDNIQKFVLHLLAQNIAQACTLLIGLAFKDESNLSVFPLSPVEVLWVIMVTSSLPDMGLGMEDAAPDILQRPPQSLKHGVFTPEVMYDMLFYGLWMSALCLSSFSLVQYLWADGDLGVNCNHSYSARCDSVFRARATTFVSMTWFSVFLAWTVVDMRRSFFRMRKDDSKGPAWTQFAGDVWRNRFLFWSVMAGLVTVFPTLYVPVINRDVFRHTGISWEWGIVFIEAVLFWVGVETWKYAKRVFFRWRGRGKHGGGKGDGGGKVFERYLSTEIGEEDKEKGTV